MWTGAEDTREILDAVRRGEGGAEDRLLARHRDAVVKLVRMRMDPRLARRVDASDVVQDALLVAHRRLADYLDGNEMPFHLWIRRIALDRLIDAHRRHREADKRSLDREASVLDERSTAELFGAVTAGEPTPGAAAVRAELLRRFSDAVAKLPDTDREILLMRHFEHLGNRDAARALGLSDAAAAMRYLRALEKLRAALKEDD